MFLGSLIVLLIILLAGPGTAAALRHRFHVSPEDIRTIDTRVLAESIVSRIHRECDQSGAEGAEERPVGDDARLIMMVPQEAFESIAQHGFLNQHATLTTRGFNRTAERFQVEQELAMLRLPYNYKGRELLPKYAFFDVPRSDFGAFSLPSRYGGAAVVFKKDVLRRATWTYADTLDFSQKTGRFGQGGAANPVLPRTARYRRKKSDRNVCVNYCEAQIWGKLTLQDVDYVMIRDTEPVLPSVLESGVPAYRYAVPVSSAVLIAPERTAQYVRGVRVASGRKPPRRKGSTVSAPAALLDGKKLAALGDAELVREYSMESAVAAPGMMSRRLRTLGELASRRKSAIISRALEETLRTGDELARALALYGLSELPPQDFKPYLLAAFDDSSPAVVVEAVALADDLRDDVDVSAALRVLRGVIERRLQSPSDAEARDIQEWLGRLDKTTLCE